MNDSSPMAIRNWSVDITITERDGRTHARARLHTADATALEATGTARLNPTDRDVPEIGEELAAARALSALAHQLLDTAADDIEGVTHKPAIVTD
jgi:Domain of unknown function (DUF1876)